MHYDLGYFDLEQKTLQPLDNPFGPAVVTHVLGTTCYPCLRARHDIPWRWKQSAVYRSQRGFPCYQGINWENFATLGCWTDRNTN
jgi:hypothetical protein